MLDAEVYIAKWCMLWTCAMLFCYINRHIRKWLQCVQLYEACRTYEIYISNGLAIIPLLLADFCLKNQLNGSKSCLEWRLLKNTVLNVNPESWSRRNFAHCTIQKRLNRSRFCALENPGDHPRHVVFIDRSPDSRRQCEENSMWPSPNYFGHMSKFIQTAKYMRRRRRD